LFNERRETLCATAKNIPTPSLAYLDTMRIRSGAPLATFGPGK
jgi:hypothetical protein